MLDPIDPARANAGGEKCVATMFAGRRPPNTKLARDATELVRESTTDLVYHHSRRVFWFGSLQGRNRGLSFDPEPYGELTRRLGLRAAVATPIVVEARYCAAARGRGPDVGSVRRTRVDCREGRWWCR